MSTCKECKWTTPSPTGDPAKGMCIVERSKLPETQKTSVAISGKMVKMNQEACERFEEGKSWENIKDLI